MPLSTFLDGQNPSQLRGLAWLSLSDVGVLETATSTSDSGGGASSSWSAAGTFPCRIDPLGAQSRVTGGQIDERSTHVVTTTPDAQVGSGARFAITGRGSFEVTAVHQRTREWLSTFEVIEIS